MVQLSMAHAVLCVVGFAGFWLVPRSWRAGFLALHGMAFLGWWDVGAVLWVLGLAVFAAAGATLPGAVLAPAGALLAWRLAPLTPTSFVVPMGLGFTTLRLISYHADRRAGRIPPAPVLDVLAFAFFFPVLLLGPLQRMADFQRYLERHRWDPERLAGALDRGLVGLFKVVVLGHWLAGRIQALLSTVESERLAVLGEAAGYGLHLYFVFAGLSDLAIALARAVGQEPGENFDHPFAKPNLTRFWESWHRTLTLWCRQYVFVPILARTRSRAGATAGAMLVLALWHEISLRYLLWGLYHAGGLLILRFLRARVLPEAPRYPAAWRVAGTLATVSFVTLGFVFTKNPDWSAIRADMEVLLWGG